MSLPAASVGIGASPATSPAKTATPRSKLPSCPFNFSNASPAAAERIATQPRGPNSTVPSGAAADALRSLSSCAKRGASSPR
eukprot:9181599-Pyramimonas_sp.AAC.1